MNKNSQSQLVEDLMSIAKLGSSEVEGLKGTFYFDDLIKLIKDIIKKLEKMMDEFENMTIPKHKLTDEVRRKQNE